MDYRSLIFGGIGSLVLMGCQPATDFSAGSAGKETVAPAPVSTASLPSLSFAGLSEGKGSNLPTDLVFKNTLLTSGFTIRTIDYTNPNHEPVRLWVEGDGNLNLSSKLMGTGEPNLWPIFFQTDTIAVVLDKISILSKEGTVLKNIDGGTKGFIDLPPDEQVSIHWQIHAINQPFCITATDMKNAPMRPYAASLSGNVHFEVAVSRPSESEGINLDVGPKFFNEVTSNWKVMPNEIAGICQGLMRNEFSQDPGWCAAGGVCP